MAKSTNSAAAARSSRKGKKSAAVDAVILSETVAINLEAAPVGAEIDPELSSLMAALDAMPGEAASTLLDDEVAAETVAGVIAGSALIEPAIEELTGALAQVEAVEEMVADATVDAADGSVSEGAGEGSDAQPGEGEAVGGAEGADLTLAPAKEKVPRKHYTNKADRIADRLGDKLVEYTVLTTADAVAAVDDEALQVKMAETMGVIRGMNKKCQNRASLFIEFVAGKKASLNEVIKRALTILAAEGKITTGKEGNLLANLLARPYSEAAARAMGGNTISMLEDLRVLTKDSKGTYLANPDSLLLAKANALLGLTPKPVETAEAA